MLMGRGVVALAGLLVTSLPSSRRPSIPDGWRSSSVAPLSWRRRRRRRNGTAHSRTAGEARATPAGETHPRRLSGERHASQRRPDAEMTHLVRSSCGRSRGTVERPLVRMTVQTIDGRTLTGELLAEGFTTSSSEPTTNGCTCSAARASAFRSGDVRRGLADLQR